MAAATSVPAAFVYCSCSYNGPPKTSTRVPIGVMS